MHLRRPGPDDPRTDPLYEFGSFGCTRCHCTNLFHPRHAEDLDGARLAFVQGGDCGSRLVFLTPPIKVRKWKGCCEAMWTPARMPFKYAEAPILVRNDGTSDFPSVERFAHDTECPTVESGLPSRLRSRASPLSVAMAKQIVAVYERQRREKPRSAIASVYYEALPYVTKVDHHRERTYRRLLRELSAEADAAGSALLAALALSIPHAGPRCGASRRRQSRCRASDR